MQANESSIAALWQAVDRQCGEIDTLMGSGVAEAVAEAVANVRERLGALESSVDVDVNRISSVEEHLEAMDSSVSAMVQSVKIQRQIFATKIESHGVDERLRAMHDSISGLSLSVDQQISTSLHPVRKGVGSFFEYGQTSSRVSIHLAFPVFVFVPL